MQVYLIWKVKKSIVRRFGARAGTKVTYKIYKQIEGEAPEELGTIEDYLGASRGVPQIFIDFLLNKEEFKRIDNEYITTTSLKEKYKIILAFVNFE